MNVGWMIGVAAVAMSATMSLLWVVQRRTGDAGIVDVAWGLGVGVLAAFFCWGSTDGDPLRRMLVAGLAGLWALRLSAYVLIRVLRMPEDGRYRTLKENWGNAAQARMFGFYQMQAAGSVLFALPMLLAARNPAGVGVWDYVGLSIGVIAIGGESLADYQLAQFRRGRPPHRGQVCQTGLWRYSRHPNYFFEWLHWWAYVFLAMGAPWGWLSLTFPAAMLFFILKVTGIPPTEAQAIKSRGEAYRRYQQTTSAFIPWPPRRSGGHA